LFKSEPNSFSIEDLEQNKSTFWDGVRNYQVRNYLRDEMKIGDRVVFYHSNSEPPAAVGVAEICTNSYPDFTAFNPNDIHFDPKSDEKNPTWFMVDILFVSKFVNKVTLQEIKANHKLEKMKLVQKGNRLSIMPIEKEEFDEILKMSKKKS